MTAKEKAKELVQLFLSLDMYDYEDYVYWLEEENAKRCALICVDEKIETLLPYAGLLDIKKEIEELEEVKQILRIEICNN